MKNSSFPKSLGMLAFVVLFLGGGATYFQYNAAQAAKADAAALENEVPSQKELEESLASSHAKLVDYQKKLEHLEGSVPDVAYIPTLMKELEEMGKGEGIEVTGVRPAPVVVAPGLPQEGKKQEKKEYAEIEIEIKGRGSYDHIKAFLDALQKFPKVIAVKTIGLTPLRESGNGATNELEAVIHIIAYVFPFELITAADPRAMGSEAGTGSFEQPPVVTTPGDKVQTSSSSNTETLKLAKRRGQK